MDNWIGRGCDVVGGAVEDSQPALGRLDGLLVVAAVVVVEETVAIDVLTVVGLEVQLAEAVVVNLFKQLPVSLDVDRSIPVARGLVIILPAEATSALALAATSTPTTIVTAAVPGTSTAGPLELLAASGSCVAATTPLATAPGEDGAPTEASLGGVPDVGNNREGGFVLGDRGSEERGRAGAVYLLI